MEESSEECIDGEEEESEETGDSGEEEQDEKLILSSTRKPGVKKTTDSEGEAESFENIVDIVDVRFGAITPEVCFFQENRLNIE